MGSLWEYEPDSGGKAHCCGPMTHHVNHRCEQHPDPFDCPDNVIVYRALFDEYGFIIHDGGGSYIEIQFCPWCAARLQLRRDRWFAELEGQGFDEPFEQEIPPQYRSHEWWANGRPGERRHGR